MLGGQSHRSERQLPTSGPGRGFIPPKYIPPTPAAPVSAPPAPSKPAKSRVPKLAVILLPQETSLPPSWILFLPAIILIAWAIDRNAGAYDTRALGCILIAGLFSVLAVALSPLEGDR